MNDAKKPGSSFRKPFTVHQMCDGRMVRYDLIPVPTGIRVIGSSEHDDLGRFSELSPCSQLGRMPNSHWEKITEWRLTEIQIVVPAMARQTHRQTADWLDSLMQHFPISKHLHLFHILLHELLMHPQAYTLDHLYRWERMECFRNARCLYIQLLANKGKRATRPMEAAIDDFVSRQKEYNEPSPVAVAAYVLMHYAATNQTPGHSFQSIWRLLSSTELKRVAKHINIIVTYHPIARSCGNRLVALAHQYFDAMPRDVREKWTNERLEIESQLKSR